MWAHGAVTAYRLLDSETFVSREKCVSFRTDIANWIVLRLLRGERPGRAGLKLIEPSGNKAVWVFDGDAIEVFYVDARTKNVGVRTSIEPENAVKLAKFILRWWTLSMWRGAKLWLWRWAMHVRSETAEPELPHVIVEVPHLPKIEKRKLNGAASQVHS